MAMDVCAYVRVSTQDQAEKFSLPAQIASLKDLARRNKYTLTEIYNEGGVSGENLVGRPEMLRLLEDAQKGFFHGVLVVALDRLSRNLSDNLFIREKLKNAGVRIVTPSQEYNPDVIEHQLTQNIFGSIADYERQRILERCQTGREEKRSRGGWLGGHAPLGYKYNPVNKSLEIDKEKASWVKMVIEHAAGHSAAETGQLMRNQGYDISDRQVRRMTEKHKLLFYSGRVEDYSGNIRKAEWPAIIPEKLADAVIQNKAKLRTRAKVSYTSHLLTGLGRFRCAKCGSTVKAFPGSKRKGRPRPQYYACSSVQRGIECSARKYIKCDRVDNLVLDVLRRALSTRSLPPKNDKRIEILSTRLKTVEGKIQKVLDLILEGEILEADGREKLRALKIQREELQGKINEHRDPVSHDLVERYLGKDLKFLSFEEKRLIISVVVDGILLTSKRLRIILRPPFEREYYEPI
ncbi:MAG: recombinase family protein [Candidatus Marinimicrobia bacterium]|nr:recombinase family protein [Candidatus Neomarinimicrobiota bacterium]